MWGILPRFDRREFLKRAAGMATLSATPLTIFTAGCTQEPRGGDSSVDAGAIRNWASELRGEVIVPGDGRYDTARRTWNLAYDRYPTAIVRCAEVQDVVKAIDFARSRDVLVAVRSGGHSQAAHSVCDGGIVIDVGGLNRVEVDPRSRVARVSAGVRVRELLGALEPHGLVTPTGGCPDVGIAGLTLGGGENLLMAKYGAVCDNVLSAEIVTADARVATASADDNPDLFWAIRGGSGNFGVVTSFEYRLHPLNQILVGMLSFPVSRSRDVLRGYRDLMRTADDDLQTFSGLMALPDGPVLAVILGYSGDIYMGEQVLSRWRSVLRPMAESVNAIPYSASANFILPASSNVGTGGFLPELSDPVVDVIADHFESAPPSSTAMWSDYHGAVTRVDVNEMAFPLRQPGYSLFIGATWNSPDERRNAVGWTTRFREAIRPFTRGVYVNTIEDEGESRVREAYGANFARLAMVKAQYDPSNVFRVNHNIVPG